MYLDVELFIHYIQGFLVFNLKINAFLRYRKLSFYYYSDFFSSNIFFSSIFLKLSLHVLNLLSRFSMSFKFSHVFCLYLFEILRFIPFYLAIYFGQPGCHLDLCGLKHLTCFAQYFLCSDFSFNISIYFFPHFNFLKFIKISDSLMVLFSSLSANKY